MITELSNTNQLETNLLFKVNDPIQFEVSLIIDELMATLFNELHHLIYGTHVWLAMHEITKILREKIN